MPSLDDASAFLESLLADGPVSAAAVRARAEAAGHSWRTIERARGLIGARSETVWTLPDAIGGLPAKLADCPPTAPPHNVIAFERPSAKAEAKPKPADSQKVRTHWGPPKSKVWAGGAILFRCAECVHLPQIEDRGEYGYCAIGLNEVRDSYGRRNCHAFKAALARSAKDAET